MDRNLLIKPKPTHHRSNAVNGSKSSISTTDSYKDPPKFSLPDSRMTLEAKMLTLMKENHQLEDKNRKIIEQNRKLSIHLREMNPSFTNNTSSSFPMSTEITIKINDFIKITCQDFFFDFLIEQSITPKGMSYIFGTLFNDFITKIKSQLKLCEDILKRTTCSLALSEPMLNVLKKTYQIHFKEIQMTIEKNIINYEQICLCILNAIKINTSKDVVDGMKRFIKKMYEIVFLCLLCTPEISIRVEHIGRTVKFNSHSHESVDGFMSNKEWCYIVIPEFYKKRKGDKDETLTKAQVIAVNYNISH